MEKKWNLQDIKPAEKKRPPVRPVTSRRMESNHREAEVSRTDKHPSNGRTRPKLGVVLVIAIVIVVALAGIFVALFTGGAKVTTFPRYREQTVNAVFEAKKVAGVGELAFEIMTLEATGEREVKVSGQENVEEQATGRITIYKNTEGSERLIKNTRFESTDGKVFRISESVVVPGATKASDGTLTPGSTSADIFADQAGAEYNLSAGAKFTVPGFKESDLDDLYTAIFAVNQSSFTGGHSGPRFIIEEGELSAATDSLRTELKQALVSRIATERPAGFVLFDSAVTFNYEALEPQNLSDGKVMIKEKTILQVPIFKNEDFASFIAASTIPGYENEAVRIDDLSTINFEYTTPPDPKSLDVISFKLVGKPKIIWTYDTEQLKKDLAGGSQTSLNTVLGGYPAIEKATATIRPFWKQSFPEDINDIEIVEELASE